MLTGEPPWPTLDTPAAVMFQIASTKKPPPIPSDLSNCCRHFISLCLQRSPEKRSSVKNLLQHSYITGGRYRRRSTERFYAQSHALPKKSKKETEKIPLLAAWSGRIEDASLENEPKFDSPRKFEGKLHPEKIKQFLKSKFGK